MPATIGPTTCSAALPDEVTERRSGDRLADDDNGLRQLLGDRAGLNACAIDAKIQGTRVRIRTARR
jgi:hypothetical protein